MLATFDTTVTVLSCLHGSDAVGGVDKWYKQIIPGCAWTSQAVSSVDGDTVHIGEKIICRIPKQPNYLPYGKWKSRPSGNLTINQGDIVIKGEMPENDLSPRNIPKLLQKYRPEAFRVGFFRDNTNPLGLLEHYRVEGT